MTEREDALLLDIEAELCTAPLCKCDYKRLLRGAADRIRADAQRIAELERVGRDVLFHFTPEHLDHVSGSGCGTALKASLDAEAE